MSNCYFHLSTMLWSFWRCSAWRNKAWHSSRLSRRWKILPCVAPHLGESSGESLLPLAESEAPKASGPPPELGRKKRSLRDQQPLPAPGGTQSLLFLPEARYWGHLAQGEAVTPKPVCSRVPEDTKQRHILSLNALSQMQPKWPDSIFIF